MKIISLITYLFLFASISYGDDQLNVKVPDTVEYELEGSVKQVSQTTKKQILVGSRKSSTSFELRTYDSKGNRLIQEKKDQDGQVIKRVEYVYDDGRFVEEIAEDFKKGTTEKLKVIIDAPQRVIIKENTETKEKKVTLYSEAGFEMKIRELGANGEATRSSEFKRLKDNKEYKLTFYDADKKRESTISIWWNRDGTKKKTKIENHIKDYVFTTEYEYKQIDDIGNWLERIEHTTLTEKGKAIDFSTNVVSREIEYY